MNALSLAMATEVAETRAALLAAQRRQDDNAAEDARNRLRDLADLANRATDGLSRRTAWGAGGVVPNVTQPQDPRPSVDTSKGHRGWHDPRRHR